MTAWFLFSFEKEYQQPENIKQTTFIEKIEGFEILSFDKANLKYKLKGDIFYRFLQKPSLILTPTITVFGANEILKIKASKMNLDKQKMVFYETVQVDFEPKSVMNASTVTIYYKSKTPEYLVALGTKEKLVTFKHSVTNKTINGSSEKMTYFVKQKILEMLNNVKYSSGNEAFRGHKLEYDLSLDKLNLKGQNSKKRIELDF
jgi:lipopolysaccharide transport protein LptA